MTLSFIKAATSELTVNSVLLVDDLLQVVVSLRTHLHGLGEAGSTSGENHELLESQGVTGVRSSVDDVERRGGESVGSRDTGELGDVLVKRDSLRESLFKVLAIVLRNQWYH